MSPVQSRVHRNRAASAADLGKISSMSITLAGTLSFSLFRKSRRPNSKR
jgi:hypothetical protein